MSDAPGGSPRGPRAGRSARAASRPARAAGRRAAGTWTRSRTGSRSRTSSRKNRSSRSFCQRRRVRADWARNGSGKPPNCSSASTSAWSPRGGERRARCPAGHAPAACVPTATSAQRERVQAVVVVAALQRVAAAPVDVEPGAARDEEAQALAVLVELALEPALPAAPLVQLVEHDQRVAAGPAGGADLPAVLAVVPAEVGAGLPASQDLARERRLADLPRAGEEDHLRPEVLPDGPLEVPRSRPWPILPQSRKCHNILCLEADPASPPTGALLARMTEPGPTAASSRGGRR